jgi:hypothetical protein
LNRILLNLFFVDDNQTTKKDSNSLPVQEHPERDGIQFREEFHQSLLQNLTGYKTELPLCRLPYH